MAPQQPYGWYSPDTARRIFSAVEGWERFAAETSKGKKGNLLRPPVRPILVKNVSGELIPRFGCVQATGTHNADGQCYLEVDKPQDSTGSAGPFFINLFSDIPAESSTILGEHRFGTVTDGPHANALVDETYAAGTGLQPQVGSWYLTSGGLNFTYIGSNTGAKLGADVHRVKSAGVGSGNVIRFQIELASGEQSGEQSGEESGEESGATDCETRAEDAPAEALARVLQRPCGVSRVPGEDDSGFVTVVDRLESFFFERAADDIDGKEGIAVYLEKEDESEDESGGSGQSGCEWVIIWIDWFRWVPNVWKVIFNDDEIRFKLKNIKVWDDCDLEDFVIPLTDCIEEESGGSGI